MIEIGKPQNMGRKTMMLIIARHTTIGFVVFIISGIIAFIGPVISSAIVGAMSLNGSVDSASVASVSGAISAFSVMALLASVILILVGMIIGIVQYRNHVFVLDEFSLKFRRGIFDQKEVTLPYRQIQDLNLTRTVMHRIFGVSRLLMVTAAHEDAGDQSESDTIFDPIDADLAVEMRHFLEHKIGVQVIERVASVDTGSGSSPIAGSIAGDSHVNEQSNA